MGETIKYPIKPCFSPTMHSIFFSGKDQSNIRTKSEVGTVKLVEASQYVYFFCGQFQGGADFVDHLFYISCLMLCSPGDIYE